MNTKPIPALTMLIAGIITCVLGFLQHYELFGLLKILVLVLVCFYLIGLITKLVLDHFLNTVKSEPKNEKEGQDISTEEES